MEGPGSDEPQHAHPSMRFELLLLQGRSLPTYNRIHFGPGWHTIQDIWTYIYHNWTFYTGHLDLTAPQPSHHTPVNPPKREERDGPPHETPEQGGSYGWPPSSVPRLLLRARPNRPLRSATTGTRPPVRVAAKQRPKGPAPHANNRTNCVLFILGGRPRGARHDRGASAAVTSHRMPNTPNAPENARGLPPHPINK
jgi:hypothetical protein